jgi:hypothetical protein
MILWLAAIHVHNSRRYVETDKNLDSVYLCTALACDVVLEVVALVHLFV